MKEEVYSIQIRKRPWWMWLLAVLWLAVEIFFLQTAIASSWEQEGQAAAINWGIFIVILIIGVVIWIFQGRSRKSD